MTTPADSQDPVPGGATDQERQRNAALLAGYDYGKYGGGCTGYAGQDLQRVLRLDRTGAAVRTRVGTRGNYKAGMTQLDDGKLVLAVCRRGASYFQEGPQNRKFDMLVYESADQGVSWQEIARPPIFAKEPSLTATADGSILMIGQYADGRPGARKQGSWSLTTRSVDGGRTWDCMNMVPGYRYPRNVLVEEDGALLYLGSDEKRQNLLVRRSRDHGRTWQESPAELRWQPEDRTGFAEISVVRLAGGKLLASMRCNLPACKAKGVSPGVLGHAFGATLLSESEDDGKIWSAPRSFTNIGEVHVVLLQLADGRLLATYANYHLPFGACAIASEDEGRSWDLDHPMQLSIAADGPMSCNGWPVTVQLPDESLVTCYASNAYALDGPPPSVCEVVRWRLP